MSDYNYFIVIVIVIVKQTLGVVSVHRATVLHIGHVDFEAKFGGNMVWYGMEIFYLTKITEVQINDTINKYIMNMSGDYT